jgi:hypothetical protein
VASVQLQTTNTTPKVGDVAHVGATPVDAQGITMQGVTCTFVSGTPAVATVNANDGTVTAISPGVTRITATCNGTSSFVDITVLPAQVKLTVTMQGNGSGGVFANPTGNGILGLGSTYATGTAVTLTQTATNGSVFMGWSAPCTSDPCNLVLNADTSVTATFTLAEKFVSGTWNVNLGTVTDYLGCKYAVSASGVLTLEVVENNGAVNGTGSTAAHVNIVTTYSPPYTTCTSNPFDTTPTGPLSGNDANLNAALANASGSAHFNFTGTRNGTTISGSATFSDTLRDGSGNQYPTSGNTGPFNLAKQ